MPYEWFVFNVHRELPNIRTSNTDWCVERAYINIVMACTVVMLATFYADAPVIHTSHPGDSSRATSDKVKIAVPSYLFSDPQGNWL